MSISINSPYKQPECGNSVVGGIKDALGGAFDLQIVGSDPSVNGIKTGASITVGTGSYAPPAAYTNQGTFLICIETAGVFYVHLEDGTDFIITAAQATTYLGQWYPAKLLSVDGGTTGNFSVGY
jgi:hypothetical protein